MAIVKVIEVKGETKNAQKSFEDLGSTIQDQKDITIEFERELARLESLLSDTSKSNLPRQKKLKDSIVQMKGALKDQRISVKELRNEQSKHVKVQNLNIDSATRNYGAIQLLDQVTGGYASQVRAAVDASKLFNLSLKGMRSAVIATGIGALVVALGLVVAYWDEIVEFITQAKAKIAQYNTKLQESIDLNQESLDLLGLQEDILNEQGLSLADILKKQVGVLNNQLASALALAQSKKELLEIAKLEAARDLRESQRAGRRNKRLKSATQTEFDESTKKEIAALEQASLDAEKQVLKLTLAIIKLTKKRFSSDEIDPKKDVIPEKDTQEQFDDTDVEEVNDMEVVSEQEKLRKIQEINDFYFLKGLEREISEIERKAEADILELKALDAHKSLIEAVEQESQNKIDEIVKKASDAKKKEIKKKESEELNSEENILSLKEKIGDQALALGKNLAKKGSDLQKTFAIAEVVRQQVKSVSETVSNTVIANSKAVAASPTTGGMPFVALNTASAALGIAGGLSAANKAISNIRSGGSTTGNSGGANRTPSAAPSFNLIEGTEGNQINESINLQNQEPIQAYVVSGDVTTAQNLDDSIISESGL